MFFQRRKFFRARVLAPLVAVVAIVLCWWHPWQPRIVIHERINPRDGAVMVWVPAGTFRMGDSIENNFRFALEENHRWEQACEVIWSGLHGEANSWGFLPHTVYLDGYWIYKDEVTVKQYRAFCRATKRQMPDKPYWGWRDNDPIDHVTWNDATAYAAWAGASLPTEAQWEKAARGPDGRIYPWGNQWNPAKCVNGSNSDEPKSVGSNLDDVSPYGAQDMAGNISEWCADWYDEKYYTKAHQRNPSGPTVGDRRVVRGGFWGDDATEPGLFRCACRLSVDPADNPADYPSIDIGFRCVVVSPGP